VQKAQQQFAILRKSAPRFWQPSEPAVLLKGPAVPSTPRHGEDGRANDDDTLTCHVLSISPTLDKGGISSQLRTGDRNKVVQTIQSTIESLRPQMVTPDTIGFSQQTEERPAMNPNNMCPESRLCAMQYKRIALFQGHL